MFKITGESSQTATNKMAVSSTAVQSTQQIPSGAGIGSAIIFSSQELAVENVMPGIYLTKNFIAWNEQNLRTHGFTHIIIIDKHIQELYYPSPVFKLITQEANVNFDPYNDSGFEYCSSSSTSSLSFGKEFEAIDLNFGEKSYLTTVLPNCYRAVKFINKALQRGGTILVIDCNGSEQKCLTIIVAYLMYKHNISFSAAFSRLKEFYNKADLDRFYISQLYEYEPILQVQRAQSRGQSCSRELHSAILKRKKTTDEEINYDTNEFLDSFNPLSHFNPTTTTTATTRTQTLLEKLKHIEKNKKQVSNIELLGRQQSTQQQTPPEVVIKKQAEFPTNQMMWDEYAMEQ
ncbi:uncharacterized protein LOC119670116 [Teleopsis dalmanni]|uniref:uncharacterized protein LOC119670116 n=1 Tax=Teleopsis dalmanni TaxID=139649 RepID=UPI0018CC9DE2|nr:uncharacterized protein LOC119670116 [Teleopsis dalmanni]XP_037936170.1 uncharacterized protein LOC119670116 [Teleopsis dalmanni]